MLKKYRNQKLIQLTLGILFLIGIYYTVDSDIIRIGMLGLFLIIGIAYNAKLLTNIRTENGFYIFETYSIITQREEIRISKSQLTEISYDNNSIFNSYNLILKHNGTNGVVNKKLYLNADPWSELIAELNRIKKTIANNVYN